MTKGSEQNIRRLTQRPNILGRIKEPMGEFPLFLFIVPLFIIIHMEQEYHKLIVYHFVYEEIIQLFLAPLIILCVCLLLYRHRRKSLMATFILMIPFYFFSDYKDAAEEYFGQSLLTRYSVMIPLLVILIGFLLIKIMRTKRHFRQAFFFINSLFSLFIIADLVVLLFFSSTTDRAALHPEGLEKQYEPCNDCIQPDIYHIVFDAYTSSSALKSVFGYDNGRLDQISCQ